MVGKQTTAVLISILARFDSIAGRLSVLPTERLALQVSGARLRDAPSDFPFPSQDPAIRMTASAVYHRPFARNGLWATTAAFGTNRARQIVPGGILDATTMAGLVESSISFSDRHTLFGRGEVGEMPAHHLHAHEYLTAVFAIGKGQIGYVRHLRREERFAPGNRGHGCHQCGASGAGTALLGPHGTDVRSVL